MAGLGHPIVGDTLYGAAGEVFRGKGLFLSAVTLEFDHPNSGERMTITADEPHKFRSYRDREHRRWQRHRERDGGQIECPPTSP